MLGGCTMMYCETPGTAYCAAFGERPGGALGGIGGQADGAGYGDAGYNCCGGGGACGYEHCPALGDGQDGCVQPWAMPNGMDFDTDCAAPGAAVVGSSGACAAALAATTTMIGSFVPQCDERGNYEPVQCHGSTGYCWCSDTEGNEIANTRQRGTVSIETCAAVTHATADFGTSVHAPDCDVTSIEAACANVDATNPKNCNSPCHILAQQMLAGCKTALPQVAADLQQMVSTCAQGH
jgi:hypothetical protein